MDGNSCREYRNLGYSTRELEHNPNGDDDRISIPTLSNYSFSVYKIAYYYLVKKQMIEIHYYYYKIPWLPLKSRNNKRSRIVT